MDSKWTRTRFPATCAPTSTSSPTAARRPSAAAGTSSPAPSATAAPCSTSPPSAAPSFFRSAEADGASLSIPNYTTPQLPTPQLHNSQLHNSTTPNKLPRRNSQYTPTRQRPKTTIPKKERPCGVLKGCAEFCVLAWEFSELEVLGVRGSLGVVELWNCGVDRRSKLIPWH